MTKPEASPLTEECGHHCGVLTSGGKVKHVGHCACSECHGREVVSTTVIDGAIILETDPNTVDPDVKENISE